MLVDPLDTAGMTDALLDALSDRSRWRRWQSAGLRAVDRYYTWKGHAKTYLKEVEKILGRPKRRRYPAPKTRLTRVDRILTTDVDNSLLGDPEALGKLKARLGEVRDHVAFGVATGRSLQSAISALRKANAPTPDFWITSVGTEIHYGEQLAADREWLRNIHWRWDVEAIKRCLTDLPGLELQSRAEQTAYKISYYIDPREAPSIAEIERTLRKRRLRCKVVFSLGQYLDIIPVRASKGLAIRYLANRWGVPMERVLVTGDCGNDIEMLTGRSLGVVVANHSDEIDPLREQEDIYFAGAGHAAGILEGVEHYDFFGALEKKEAPSHRPDARTHLQDMIKLLETAIDEQRESVSRLVERYMRSERPFLVRSELWDEFRELAEAEGDGLGDSKLGRLLYNAQEGAHDGKRSFWRCATKSRVGRICGSMRRPSKRARLMSRSICSSRRDS
ncbi:MAG: HAD-IIB family hydrolase [Bryobacterales bacterium]